MPSIALDDMKDQSMIATGLQTTVGLVIAIQWCFSQRLLGAQMAGKQNVGKKQLFIACFPRRSSIYLVFLQAYSISIFMLLVASDFYI